MGAFLNKLILLLLVGLALFVISPASAAVAAAAENRASGSAAGLTTLIEIETRLSEEAVRENAGLDYDLASDDAVAAKSLGANPFNGRTPQQIDKLLRDRGFISKGPDPASGRGSYINPETGRKYYLDPGGTYRKGIELPHVDIHRIRDGVNLEREKRKLPLGDALYE